MAQRMCTQQRPKTTAAEMKAKNMIFVIGQIFQFAFYIVGYLKFDEYFKKYEIFITGVECCNKITLYID